VKFLKLKPLLSLFLLAYAFTWWISPLGFDSFPVFPYGPFVAVLLLVGLTAGRDGVRRMLRSLGDWRAHPKWYAFAVFLPLLIAVPAVLVMRPLGAPASAMPTAASALEFLVVLPIMIVVGGPLGEELAWRGYALPVLQQRHRPLVAVLVLAVGHAVWHLPLFFTDEPPAPGPWILGLLSGGVVLAWLWNCTGRILLPILLHGANNAAEQAFMQGFTSRDADHLAWIVALGWTVAAMVIIWRTHGTLASAAQRPVTVPLHERARLGRPRRAVATSTERTASCADDTAEDVRMVRAAR
jgi:membrane protease YdiL (CAAX protease family)